MGPSFTIRLFSFLIFSVPLVSTEQGDQANMQLKIWQMADDSVCRVKTCPMPDGPQWKRLQKACCKFGGKYHCQVNEQGNAVHVCMDPVTCPAGTFLNLPLTTLTTGLYGFSCQTCFTTEFQPQATLSYHFTRPGCHKKSRFCHDMNAMMMRTGTPTSDILCKCNCVLGYRPVPLTDHDCREFESTSECKCKHDPCPPGQLMTTTDFQCVDTNLDTVESYRADLDISRQALEDFKDVAGRLQDELHRITSLKSFFVFDEIPVCEAGTEDFKPIMGPVTVCVVPDGIHHPFVVEYFPEFLQSFLPHEPQPIRQESSMSVFELLALVTVVITCSCGWACFIRRRKKGLRKKSIIVQMTFPSKKSCEDTHTELKNILPFLARQYGHLTLVHNRKSRQVIAVVSPGLAKHEFRLSLFVRDLLSPESIKRILAASSTGTDNGVKIVAFHTPPEKTANCSWKCTSHATNFKSHLTNNTGEVVLRLSDSVDNTALLRELKACTQQIKSIFERHNLQLSGVHRGSVRFLFHLPHDSKTLDTMAVERRYTEFAKDLLSNPAFTRLCAGQRVKCEFVCKAKLDIKVAVIYTENLYWQIGARNALNICDDPTPHDHSETQNQDDGHLDITEANGEDVSFADVQNVTIVSVSPRPGGNIGLDADHREVSSPRNRKVVQILISCPDNSAMSSLWSHWSNVLALLQRYHPGCRLKRQVRKLVWELSVMDDSKPPDVCHFLDEVFSIENARQACTNNNLKIEIAYPPGMKAMIPLRQRRTRFFWRPCLAIVRVCGRVLGVFILALYSKWHTPAAALLIVTVVMFMFSLVLNTSTEMVTGWFIGT